jgi:protein ImuB
MHALWLCLHLPQLPLDALGPWPEPLAALPVLVWEADGRGARLVCSANPAARGLGAVPGQRLGSAQALAPQALLLARDPVREAAALQRLALALGSLTPSIEIAPPAQLLLDIHASLRLFGGLRALLRRALALARGSGFTLRCGLAATPLAAQWLAAQADPPDRRGRRPPGPRRRCIQLASTRRALQPLPLALVAGFLANPVDKAIDTTADSLQMLQALGARRVADLRRLPRSGLARRGAAAWLDALDRAEGRRPDPRRWFEPPEACRLGLELPHPAEAVPALEAALAPLVQALCGWLALRWRAAQGIELRLQHEYGARRRLADDVLTLDLATPSRDAAHLLTLLRERLQRIELRAPVDRLTLDLTRHLPDAGRPRALLPDALDDQTHADARAGLIDRLRARLGADRVQCIQLQADARPEYAERRLPAEVGPGTGGAAPPARRPPSADHGLPRPTWLLATPQPLPLSRNGELPLHLGRPLRLLTRAERIETGWHDSALVRRDYHVALADDGTLCWVYRDRSPAVTAADAGELAAPRWFLHGLFG